MNMDKTLIFCDICGIKFDSQDFEFCKSCEFYTEGIDKFGHTKSNAECKLELLIEIRKNDIIKENDISGK